ncbi:MAG: ribosome biogenesis GTP-binding protein YihA/YsxC [Rickettsiales bacterium]
MQDYLEGNFTLHYCAHNIKQLKYNNLREIAFFGRSNVGKSSLLNNICKNKNLAKTSKTPGRTASINFFINQSNNLLIADLPGYGYAHNKQSWGELISYYLAKTQNLTLAFLLLDSRRGIMEIDFQLLEIFKSTNVKFALILTKIDKLTSKERENIYNIVKEQLDNCENFSGQVFALSNLKKTGITSLKKYINKILWK